MMTPRIRTSLRHRAAVALAVAALGAGLLAGCGDGAETDCSISDSQCTITFERDEEGSATVLGVNVELVSATDSEATVSVAGRETTLPVNDSREIAGFDVQLRSITADTVVVVVSR